MRLKKTYGSREVASLTGLSARQLQLWDASGLVPAAVHSHRTTAGGYTERRYTAIDLFELLVLADLRRRGFTVQQLHEIVRAVKEQFGLRLFDATGGGGGVQLLTDGREIYARTTRGEIFNLLEAPDQPLLVLGGEGLLKELSGKVRSEEIGKIFSRSSAGRGMTCTPTSSPTRRAAAAPASVAAFTEPTSPRTIAVTRPASTFCHPTNTTFAALHMASAASIIPTRPRVSTMPSASPISSPLRRSAM